jgi:hypothetical protein
MYFGDIRDTHFEISWSMRLQGQVSRVETCTHVLAISTAHHSLSEHDMQTLKNLSMICKL